ncbi:septum formation family protein [Pseudarthrobacter sp. H2]|uniref:septum formation family protein n=1 Tax=Pseudarthrobacter sp. H2 TaxID=3418415 RepID=UPI003CEA565A
MPPASREDTRTFFTYSRRRTTAGTAASGASRLVSARAAQVGGWLRRQGLPRVGAGVAGLLVLGVLAWWLASSFGGGSSPSAGNSSPAPAAASSAPASRGPLPLEGVNALDFRLGDCFKDFDPEAPQSTVVACETGHSAQLIAVETYPAEDAYPGRDPLKQKALDACKAAPLTDKRADYVLSYKLAYPSATSWDKGDRRVDCFVTADTGNAIMQSLLPQP